MEIHAIADILNNQNNQTIQPGESVKACKCGGEGWYVDFDEKANMGAGAHRAKTCICAKIKKAKLGEIPEEFKDKKFTDLRIYKNEWNHDDKKDPGNALAVSIAKDFIDRFDYHQKTRTGPFFTGKPGRGKSMLCSIIFQELCNNNHYPVYLHFRRFLDKLIETYQNNEGIFEKDYFETIQEADVVIIDELRTAKKNGQVSDWQQDKILKILDLARVVVIDSNYDLAWIAENIGDHIASRISAKCGKPVTVGGPDHRIINGNINQNQIIERVKMPW
jgi:DNA replication protein DnaC